MFNSRLYDYLTDQGFDPGLVEDESEIVICCPLCQDDRPRLYLNGESGAWLCFHCHEEGSLHQFLMDVCELDGSQAMSLASEWRADQDDWDVDIERTARIKKELEVIPELKLPPAYRPLTEGSPEVFKRYLEKRGVSLPLAQSREIGYAQTGRYNNRVIVPVKMEGFLYTFVARTILRHCPNCTLAVDDCICRPYKFPKVLTPTKKEGSQPSNMVFNLDAVKASHSERLIVVEGMFDALRLPDEAVALMKSAASGMQLTLIAGLARKRKVIICLDADEAGYKGAAKLAEELLAQTIQPYIAILPPGEDPGSVDKKILDEALTQARPYVL